MSNNGRPDWFTRTPAQRFFEFTIPLHCGCWIWLGSASKWGYGQFDTMKHGEKKRWSAHRWSYVHHRGPVPEGLELDHLCRTRLCVNPWHLEAVTKSENIRRGDRKTKITQCPHGHCYDEQNTRWYQGRRYCRACHSNQRRTARTGKEG